MVTKWDFNNYYEYLSNNGIKYSDIFESIKDIAIKTLITIHPHVINAMLKYAKSQDKCYDLYGFDILVDSNLKAYLLEVNICPSLASSSHLDKRIKTILLSDLFHMVGLKLFDKSLKYEREEDEMEVIY